MHFSGAHGARRPGRGNQGIGHLKNLLPGQGRIVDTIAPIDHQRWHSANAVAPGQGAILREGLLHRGVPEGSAEAPPIGAVAIKELHHRILRIQGKARVVEGGKEALVIGFSGCRGARQRGRPWREGPSSRKRPPGRA